MTYRFRCARVAVTVVAVAITSACAPSDKEGRVPLGTPAAAMNVAQTSADTVQRAEVSGLAPGAVIALDLANSAYRKKKFDDALTKYREAAAISPNHAAPWFGLYMVASELKNTALADSAMRRVKALSADPAALGAHAEVANDASNGGPPSGHPRTKTVMPGHPSTPSVPSDHPSTQALPPGHPTPGTQPTNTVAAPKRRAASSGAW